MHVYIPIHAFFRLLFGCMGIQINGRSLFGLFFLFQKQYDCLISHFVDSSNIPSQKSHFRVRNLMSIFSNDFSIFWTAAADSASLYVDH